VWNSAAGKRSTLPVQIVFNAPDRRQRLGPEQHLIGIAHHSGPAEISNAIQDHAQASNAKSVAEQPHANDAVHRSRGNPGNAVKEAQAGRLMQLTAEAGPWVDAGGRP